MLSRVAESLYWMSRYLERAEHTARLVNVNLNLTLDRAPADAARHWGRLLASLPDPPPWQVRTTPDVVERATVDLANRELTEDSHINGRRRTGPVVRGSRCRPAVFAWGADRCTGDRHRSNSQSELGSAGWWRHRPRLSVVGRHGARLFQRLERIPGRGRSWRVWRPSSWHLLRASASSQHGRHWAALSGRGDSGRRRHASECPAVAGRLGGGFSGDTDVGGLVRRC